MTRFNSLSYLFIVINLAFSFNPILGQKSITINVFLGMSSQNVTRISNELNQHNINLYNSSIDLAHTKIILASNGQTYLIDKLEPQHILQSPILYPQYMNPIMDQGYVIAEINKLEESSVDDIIVNTSIGLILYAIQDCNSANYYFELALEKLSKSKDGQISGGEDGNLRAILAFYRGNCSLVTRDYKTSIEFFKDSIASDYRAQSSERILPTVNNYATAINLAWAYWKSGQEEESLRFLDSFLEETPFPNSKSKLLSGRAQLYNLAFRYDDAITDLTSAIQLAPTDPALYVLRGQTYLLLYQWDNVAADYNKAIELDPKYADAYFYRGVLYYSILQTGHSMYTDALTDFQHYLELAPDGEHAAEATRYATDIQTQINALNN